MRLPYGPRFTHSYSLARPDVHVASKKYECIPGMANSAAGKQGPVVPSTAADATCQLMCALATSVLPQRLCLSSALESGSRVHAELPQREEIPTSF